MTSWYLPKRTSPEPRRRGATWFRRPEPCEPARQDAVDGRRVAVLADQLRPPLTALHGAVQTLRRPDVEIGEDVRAELLEMAAERAEHLRGIVDDLVPRDRRAVISAGGTRAGRRVRAKPLP